jgi:hypothetical protein
MEQKIKLKDMTKEQYSTYLKKIRAKNKGSKITITHLDKELVDLISKYLANKEGK